MFERFTERARQPVFFARYHAEVFGSLKITAEELLLGILSAGKNLDKRLEAGAAEAIQKELEPLAPPKQRILTPANLTLTAEGRSALAFAAEEAKKLGHKHIDSPHLLLGLLRVEDSRAAQLLGKHAATIEKYRQILAQGRWEQG